MSEWRTLAVWGAVAVGCYLAAGVAFLTVLFGAGVFGPNPDFGALTGPDLAALLVSVVLFAVGGYAMRRARRPAQPESSPLPPQFRRGPGPGPPDPEAAAEAAADPAGPDTVRCAECGAENEAEYTFCENCSAKLPE